MKENIKKIVVITCAKNENDIIESYCRYNLTFCDAMLIYEGKKSSDNTREIIQSLINEGLPIHFEAEEADIYYEDVKSILAQIAVDKYKADLIVQLDADEFLCRQDGTNPREILESLSEDTEYQIPWRTYVYDESCEDASLEATGMTGTAAGEIPAFLPGRFKKYRNPLLEQAQGHAGKALISRYLLREMKAELTHGVHCLAYPQPADSTDSTGSTDNTGSTDSTGSTGNADSTGSTGNADSTGSTGNAGKAPEIETRNDFFIAHYPIRSKAQIIYKTIPNYVNKWTLPEHLRVLKDQISQFQLGMLFETIKEHGGIQPDIMQDISVKYSLYNPNADTEKVSRLLETLGDELLMTGAIDTGHCRGKLTPRYTATGYRNEAFLKAALSTIDKALVLLDDESRKKTVEIGYQELRYEDLFREYIKICDTLEAVVQHRDSLIAKCGNLEEQLDVMRNSTAWKIGHRITRVLGIFKRNKK